MRKLFVTALIFLSMTSMSQSNYSSACFGLVLVTELDTNGRIIQYYCHSGKERPVENGYYLEEIKTEAKEEETLIINYL